MEMSRDQSSARWWAWRGFVFLKGQALEFVIKDMPPIVTSISKCNCNCQE